MQMQQVGRRWEVLTKRKKQLKLVRATRSRKAIVLRFSFYDSSEKASFQHVVFVSFFSFFQGLYIYIYFSFVFSVFTLWMMGLMPQIGHSAAYNKRRSCDSVDELRISADSGISCKNNEST